VAEDTTTAGIVDLVIRATDELSAPLREVQDQLSGLVAGFEQVATAAAELFAVWETLKHIVGPAMAIEDAMSHLDMAGASADQLALALQQADDAAMAYGTSTIDNLNATTAAVRNTGNMVVALQLQANAQKLALVTQGDVAASTALLSQQFMVFADRTKPLAPQLDLISDKMAVMLTQFPAGSQALRRFQTEMFQLSRSNDLVHTSMDQMLSVAGLFERLNPGRGGAMQAMLGLSQIFGTAKGKKDWFGAGFSIASDDQGKTIDLLETVHQAMLQHPQDLEKFAEAHGIIGSLLVEMSKHYQELVDDQTKFANAGGTLDIDVGKALTLLSAQLRRLTSAFNVIAEHIGAVLIPPLTFMVRLFADATDAVIAFGEQHPIIWDIAGAVTAIGVAASATAATIGLISVALRFMGGALATSGLGMLLNPYVAAAVAAAVAIGVAAYEIYKNWDYIKRTFHDGMDDVRFVMGGVVNFVQDPIPAVRQAAQALGDALSPPADLANRWRALDPLSGGGMGNQEIIRALAQKTGDYGDAAKRFSAGDFIQEPPEHLSFMQHLARSLEELQSTMLQFHVALDPDFIVRFGKAWETLQATMDPVFEWLGSKLDWLTDKFEPLQKAILGSARALGDFIGQHLHDAAASLVPPPFMMPALPQTMFNGQPLRFDSLLGREYSYPAETGRRSGEAAPSGPVTYSPTINLTVTGSGTPESVHGAVTDALTQSQDAMARMMKDIEAERARTSFAPLSYGEH